MYPNTNCVAVAFVATLMKDGRMTTNGSNCASLRILVVYILPYPQQIITNTMTCLAIHSVDNTFLVVPLDVVFKKNKMRRALC